MKRVFWIWVAAACVVFGSMLAVTVTRWRRSPSVLLRKLEKGRGDKNQIAMLLNMARGDVTGLMVEAFSNPRKPASFRAEVLELLLKKHLRVPDERTEKAMSQALTDPGPAIRKAAANHLVYHGSQQEQLSLLPHLADADSAVQRLAYTAFLTRTGSWSGPGIWEIMTMQQRDSVLAVAGQRMKADTGSPVQLLARALIDKEIQNRCKLAGEASQRTEVAKAESLYFSAIALDTGNYRPKIKLMRHYLSIGQTQKALQFGRQNDVVMEIPRLPRAPVVDGDASEQVWKRAYFRDRSYRAERFVGQPGKDRTETYIGHYNNVLYFAVKMYGNNLEKLVAKLTKRDADLWLDDCVEFFIDPDNSERKYYQFIVNSIGTFYDHANWKPWKDRFKENFDCQRAAKVFADQGYWACEFAVPASELANKRIRANSLWGLNVRVIRMGISTEYAGIWPLYNQHSPNMFPLAVFKM